MDTLIMVSIMTILLLSGPGSARALTLVASNQLQTRGNVPVFVSCEGTIPKMSKSVPLGQVSLIEIPPIASNNATDGNSAGSRVQLTVCVGTFYAKPHLPTHYGLYNSHTDSTVCKNVCFVALKDDGFYRWNNDKNVWDKIPPIIFWS